MQRIRPGSENGPSTNRVFLHLGHPVALTLTSNLFLRCSDLVVIFLSFIGIITIIIDGSNPVKGHADGTEIEA
jgi:hypothetical protein